MRSFIDGCVWPALMVIFVILLWTIMVVGCQANPVPAQHINPFLTEDQALEIMRTWHLDGDRGIPRILLQPEWRCYYVGVDYGKGSPGFVWLGAGTTLEAALRQLVERKYIRDRAKVQEFLRRK